MIKASAEFFIQKESKSDILLLFPKKFKKITFQLFFQRIGVIFQLWIHFPGW